jgi:threonine dehydrogenase-like Zn-dependent dehydrogenase
MKAAIFRHGEIVVGTLADPVPSAGQVLVKSLACGICGSDLHAHKHGHRMADVTRRIGGRRPMDLSRDVVFGHEFCAELLDYGPETQRRLKPGTRVCSVPIMPTVDGPRTVGYSNEFPGGFAEHMVLSEGLLIEVPNGLSAEHAALTEPLAVGIHAVEKAAAGSDDVPLVIGCGPVGLAVITALKLKNLRPIVAADFSPTRRRLAERLGADVVVDPAASSPYQAWMERAAVDGTAVAASGYGWGVAPPHRPALIFECVGVPGMLQALFEGAPRGARIVVVGVCMELDRLEPMFGISKELNVQFVLGYTAEEFARALRLIAEGHVEAGALITGKVGVEGVKDAFDQLANPERHTKILVEPWR